MRLKEYQSYDEKRREIEHRFGEQKKILSEKIAKLESDNENGKNNELISKIKASVKLIDEQKSKEISELELSQKNVKTVLTEMYNDLSQKTSSELDKINERVQKFLQMLEGEYNIEIGLELGISEDTFDTLKKDPQQLENLQKKGKEIKQTTIESKGLFKSLGANIKEAFNAKNPDAFREALSKVGSKIQSITQMTGMFANVISEIGEATGDNGLKEFAQDLQNMLDVANSTMQGIQAGASFGPAGAIVGGTLGFITSSLQKSNEIDRKHRESMLKIRQSEISQQRIYNQLLWEENLAQKEKTTIFGENKISKAIGQLTSYTTAFQEYQKKFKKTQRQEEMYFLEYIKKLTDNGMGMDEAVNKAHKAFDGNFFRKKLVSFEASELSNITLKSGSYTTGRWFWKKHHDVYDGLLNQYPDLIDKSGEFNRALAQSIVDSREFGEGGKEALQEIIQQYDNMKKSQEEFDQYLQETFGALGTGFVDAVVNALKTGEDAFEAFAKTAGDVIGNLGKQLIQELFVTERFKKFKEDIRKSYEQGGSAEDVAKRTNNIVSGFVRDQKSNLKEAEKFWESYVSQAEQNGLNMSNFAQTRQAQTKGFASMTQDQASELNAKFTLGIELDRVRNTHLENITKNIAESYKFLQENSAKQLKHLAGIEVNTYTLHQMSKDMSSMKQSFDEIKLHGLKMK